MTGSVESTRGQHVDWYIPGGGWRGRVGTPPELGDVERRLGVRMGTPANGVLPRAVERWRLYTVLTVNTNNRTTIRIVNNNRPTLRIWVEQ